MWSQPGLRLLYVPRRSLLPAFDVIETLPSGSLRVRVYAGIGSVSKKRRHLIKVIPAGACGWWWRGWAGTDESDQCDWGVDGEALDGVAVADAPCHEGGALVSGVEHRAEVFVGAAVAGERRRYPRPSNRSLIA
jgi:hypothetical protein